MRKFSFCALLCCCGSTYAQVAASLGKATVVFFTPGGHWRGMGEKLNPFALKAKTASVGVVYEGTEPIARLTHSRFIVLRVAPGTHTFSAGRMEHVPKDSTAVTLQPNSVTYFAVTTTAPSMLAGYAIAEKSHLEAVSCSAFAEDHAGSKSEPAERSQVSEKFRSDLDESTDPAQCRS